MPRYKEGTPTDYQDIHGEIIRIKDQVKAPDGALWRINSYGQCERMGDGVTRSPKEVKLHLCELWDPCHTTESSPVENKEEKPEQTDQSEQPKRERTVLTLYTDQELAEELRRRGFELSATKTVTLTL